jgi:hypothetical protein
MYNHSMRYGINRSPDAGDAGSVGGAAPVDTSTADVSVTPAATPEYASKSDFEKFRNDFGSFQSQIEGYFKKQPEARQSEAKTEAPKRPAMKDFDFTKGESEVQKYEDAMEDWRESVREAKRAERDSAKQSEEKAQRNAQGHNSRMAEYFKENPASRTEIEKGRIRVLDPVRDAVYASRNGHLAVHYMAQNPGTDQELNMLAETEGPEAVRERIGEIVAEMKRNAKEQEGNIAAASQKPLRDRIRPGGQAKAEESQDYGKIFKKFRS